MDAAGIVQMVSFRARVKPRTTSVSGVALSTVPAMRNFAMPGAQTRTAPATTGPRVGSESDGTCEASGAARISRMVLTERDDLHMLDSPPQEPRSHLPKMRFVIRDHEEMVMAPSSGEEPACIQLRRHDRGRLLGGVDQRNARSH